jgi:hypothetical protein
MVRILEITRLSSYPYRALVATDLPNSGQYQRTSATKVLGVIFDSSCATAAQAATVEHELDRP